MAKRTPLLLDQNLEPNQGSVERIQHQLCSCNHLGSAIPSVTAVREDRAAVVLQQLHRTGDRTQDRTHLLVPLRIGQHLEEVVVIALVHVGVEQVAHLLQTIASRVDVGDVHEEDLRPRIVRGVFCSLPHALIPHRSDVAASIHEIVVLRRRSATSHQLADQLLVHARLLHLQSHHRLRRPTQHRVRRGMTPHGHRHTTLATILAHHLEVLIREVCRNQEARRIRRVGVVSLDIQPKFRTVQKTHTIVVQCCVI